MQFLHEIWFSYFFLIILFLLLQFKMGDLSYIRKMKLEEKEKKIENKFSWEKRENLFGGQRWNWMDSL